MALTTEAFLAENPYFNGRRPAVIREAIDEASKMFDAQVCGNLYDNLVAAQARVTLLSDPNGMPTSATGDKSGLLEVAEERLKKLKRLVPIRGLGTRTR